MKRFIPLIMIATSACAAADDEERSVDASPDGLVSISNTAGSIDVRGWSRNQVDVRADLGSGVDELVVERDGDKVLVQVKTRRSMRSSSTDLHVRVPENSSIELSGISAVISVAGVLGAQRLQSISGDIETMAHEADVDIETVSGDVDLEGDRRPIHVTLSTVSGDIDVDNVFGDIKSGSVSGDLYIVDGEFNRVSMNTTSGDMVFQATLLGDGRFDVETINGDVDIKFAGEISASFDIETFNGEIRNCFGPEPVRTSRYAPGRELSFTEGGGSSRVIIRTLNGDLRLCRDE